MTPASSSAQKGFTLVEIAIVMTIVGIALGAILQGKALIDNARIGSTISQINAVETAALTFRDIYGYMPGDLREANKRVAACATTQDCEPTGPSSLAELAESDKAIGIASWGKGGWEPQIYEGGGVTTYAYETRYFWAQLVREGLISGISLAGNDYALGVTHPRAPVGGGLVVGYADGSELPGWDEVIMKTEIPQGNVLMLVTHPKNQIGTEAGAQAITPGQAYKIDRRFDDSLPLRGHVTSTGTVASCLEDNAYNEKGETRDCNLVFRIRG